MICEKIKLTENAYMDTYVPDKIQGYTGKAILVIPGGGYSCVCSDREGEPIALAFLKHGYSSFVLHYSTGMENNYPKQLIEASLAIKHIKDNAENYGIDPEEVFAVGFSAGGHLAGSLAVLWNEPKIQELTDIPYGYNKPKGVMMIYPVVSGDETISHPGSFCNLLGKEKPTKEELERLSLENRVDENAVPVFLVHTSNDGIVNVCNSLRLGEAYRKNNKKFEMHIYPDGPHGWGLGNKITSCGYAPSEDISMAKWVDHAAEWANNPKAFN